LGTPLRASGSSFWERHGTRLAWQHRKVMDAIVRCRTAALGGHRDQCLRCGHQAISYNSCRNRHCPKCQGNARAKWLAARSAELLPVPYFHIVFTLPHELSALVLQNKRLLYDLMFRTCAATLLEVARDPKYLGANIGVLSVLHTWGQNLQHHPHVHCVVPAGGLALDGSGWVAASPRFFLPVRVLSRVFRGKFTAALKQLFLLVVPYVSPQLNVYCRFERKSRKWPPERPSAALAHRGHVQRSPRRPLRRSLSL
jgi:hypothetical protein